MDGGDHPQRSPMAKRTGGHIQSKHTPQEPGPAPGGCANLRLLPIHTLLARRWDNRLSQLAMRRQTPRIAHDKALRNRGDLTLWLSQEAIDAWTPPMTGRRGA